MNNTIIPYGKQNITQQDIDVVIEVLQSDYLTQGPRIKEFEDHFASLLDTFEEPLYKGKTLFSRKPKINPAWEQLCMTHKPDKRLFDCLEQYCPPTRNRLPGWGY